MLTVYNIRELFQKIFHFLYECHFVLLQGKMLCCL